MSPRDYGYLFQSVATCSIRTSSRVVIWSKVASNSKAEALKEGIGIANIINQRFLHIPAIGAASLTVTVIEISELLGTLPSPGPYIWIPYRPHPVYRLYEDAQ